MKLAFKEFTVFIILFGAVVAVISAFKTKEKKNTGTVKITFKNTVHGAPLVLDDSSYTNPFGETYTVKKFRYYITNVKLNAANNSVREDNSYHLVDQRKEESLSFILPAKFQNYISVTFLLGVDSLRNVSGAQTGALDPMNDMFGTWNSGYVMAKLEGNSSASSLPNNMFEYHIGGFSGVNNVLKTITLEFPASKLLQVQDGTSGEVVIGADIEKWWKNANEIKIRDQASITSPGALAKKISDNYAGMFSIVNVSN